MKFKAKIERGYIEFENPEAFTLQKSKLEGREVIVELNRYRKTRSDNQNKYMWKVVIPAIGAQLGYFDHETNKWIEDTDIGPEELLFWVKQKVGHCDDMGVALRSKTLNTVEFETLMTAIRTWGSVRGIDIPMPNEDIDNYL